MTMDSHVDLRLLEASGERALMGSPTRTVPLFWLALFDYDDTRVEGDEGSEVLVAETTVASARQRSRELQRVLPAGADGPRAAVKALGAQLELAPADARLAFCPDPLLSGLPAAAVRSATERLVNLCDLLERLRRGGLAWTEARQHLARTSPEGAAMLQQQDSEALRDALAGRAPAAADHLEQLLVRTGQGQDDLQPEALVAGDRGLLLGRFDGVWKLMSAGTDHDLRGIWGREDTAFVVGGGGTVLRLRDGQCAAMELPTDRDLRAIWGLSARMVCVVGDAGTVLMFTGRSWQPWEAPTEGALHTISGSGPEQICIAGMESSVLAFDGHGWNRLALPEGTVPNRLSCVEGTIYAAGRSGKGGVLLRLQGESFVPDLSLPPVDSLQGLWSGWDGQLGAVSGTGPALLRSGQQWTSEPVPAQWIHATAAGALAMAVGTAGGYSVILARGDGGWRVEASVRGLRLNDIWVGGKPKPPRLDLRPPPER
jgi:hypothetical protein